MTAAGIGRTAVLATAATQAALGDHEIQATLNSARRTTQNDPSNHPRSPEAETR